MTSAEIQSTAQAVLSLIEGLPLPVRNRVVEVVRKEYPATTATEVSQRKDFDAEAFFQEANRFVEEGRADYQRSEIQSTAQAVLSLIEGLPLPVRNRVVQAVRDVYSTDSGLVLPDLDDEAQGIRMSIQDFEQIYKTFRQTGVVDLSQGEIVK